MLQPEQKHKLKSHRFDRNCRLLSCQSAAEPSAESVNRQHICFLILPAHDLVGEEDATHLRVLVLAFIQDGLMGQKQTADYDRELLKTHHMKSYGLQSHLFFLPQSKNLQTGK